MPNVATIEDVQSIALRKALESNRTIRGFTVSEPRYVSVPDEDDPDAVLEFVIDVEMIDGVSQNVPPGSGQLPIVHNVIVAPSATGDIVATLLTPVEMQVSVTGQLTVIGRAKIKHPQITVTSYSYSDLHLLHLAELDVNSEGSLCDPFGRQVGDDPSIRSPIMRVTSDTTTRLSSLEELALDDSGSFLGLGVNTLRRIIRRTTRSIVITSTDSISVTETSEAI